MSDVDPVLKATEEMASPAALTPVKQGHHPASRLISIYNYLIT